MGEAYIQVERLRKVYGGVPAVDDISFAIEKGEVFGLLGPNGAGKTTTLEIMEGLRTADSGRVSIAGLDIARNLGRLKQIIGVQLQATSLYERIKVGEALALFGSYYQKSLAMADLLHVVSLEEKKDAYVKNLSGGQLQRLAVALAVVNDPELVFLDEPTTGLDPQARQNLWAIIEQMKTEGRTVILTTHYMEEAERLADRVAIIDHGKIIALETPSALIHLLDSGGKIVCTVDGTLPLADLEQVPEIRNAESSDGSLSLQVSDTKQAMMVLLKLADEHGVRLEDLHVRRPNLEDVFLQLTGRRLRE